MKLISGSVLLLLASSSQAVKLTFEDGQPETAAEAMGMRESDFLSEHVDNIMEQAKESMRNSAHSTREAAFARVKAQSPTHSINYMNKPEKPKAKTDEEELPEIQM